MIQRYTRNEMGQLWTPESRFNYLMKVEVQVALAQGQMGIIPQDDAHQISEKADFDFDRVLEIEQQTRHDVIAFVSAMAEKVGPSGRYIHFGMTSSDVLDTALSLQIREAGLVLKESFESLIKSLTAQSLKHKATLCSGRTHGMHAEPTTLGFKLLGHLFEFKRAQKTLEESLRDLEIVKLSGAVGTSSSLPMELESKVGESLKLNVEPVATQVIPRDRHARLFNALALVGGALERLSVELRHLQRTEVGEVFEGFKKGQKGSSAMPHKKNPISSENITGVARLLRSHAGAALENIALWHERDISHSSVERVILPDAFILTDYALHRMAGVVENLDVDEPRMLENMKLSKGSLFSSHLLLLFVETGLSREEAYKKVQSLTHGLKPHEHLEEVLLDDSSHNVPKDKIKELFQGKKHLAQIIKRFDEAMKTI